MTLEELSDICEQAANNQCIRDAFRVHVLNESDDGVTGFSSIARRFALDRIPELNNFTIVTIFMVSLAGSLVQIFQNEETSLSPDEKSRLIQIASGFSN
jgi:hypothetical protein